MASPPPTGLLPSEVAAQRALAGVSPEQLASAFGVSENVVERWERLGVPTGPTALAIRLVADSMDFEFPSPERNEQAPCELCGAPSAESFADLNVCPACHRDPVTSMEQLGFVVTKSHNVVSNATNFNVHVPKGREFAWSGRFLSEGLGTLLTKIFKHEPQLGEKNWDDAVYVQWIEPSLDAIGDAHNQNLIRSLVEFGLVEVESEAVSVSNVTAYGSFDEEIILMCGLLASRST